MDVVAVEAAARAVHACASHKPYVLECGAYRLGGHSMCEPQLYRGKAEVEGKRKDEPFMGFQGWLQANNLMHPGELPRLEAEVDAEIAAAVAFAEAGTWEPVEQLTRYTYADVAAPAGATP